ncbi:hypothetical protein CHS0354_006628, partial [Potamilus streckersoni]
MFVVSLFLPTKSCYLQILTSYKGNWEEDGRKKPGDDLEKEARHMNMNNSRISCSRPLNLEKT